MKKLENEYLEKVNLEVPDLWDRINGALNEIEASNESVDVNEGNKNNKQDKEEAVTEEAIAIETEDTRPNSNIKVFSRRRLARIGGVVAAAASLFLVVNVVRLGVGNISMETSAPAFDSDIDYTYSTEAASDAEASYETNDAMMPEDVTYAGDESYAEEENGEMSLDETLIKYSELGGGSYECFGYEFANKYVVVRDTQQDDVYAYIYLSNIGEITYDQVKASAEDIFGEYLSASDEDIERYVVENASEFVVVEVIYDAE